MRILWTHPALAFFPAGVDALAVHLVLINLFCTFSSGVSWMSLTLLVAVSLLPSRYSFLWVYLSALLHMGGTVSCLAVLLLLVHHRTDTRLSPPGLAVAADQGPMAARSVGGVSHR